MSCATPPSTVLRGDTSGASWCRPIVTDQVRGGLADPRHADKNRISIRPPGEA